MWRSSMSKPARLATLLICSLALGIFTSLRTDDHDEFGDEMTWFTSDWLHDDDNDEPAEGRETLAEGHWPLRGAEQRKLSSGSPPRCEHTVDGRLALVDDRGFVCPHRMIGYDGCCNLSAAGATADIVRQFACDRCDASGCCDELEACISCCLKPKHRTGFSAALASRPQAAKLARFKDLMTPLDTCVVLCRHTSEATVHENEYSSERHHCFAAAAPPPGAGKAGTPTLELVLGAAGKSCDEVCASASSARPNSGPLGCHGPSLQWVNACPTLRHHHGTGGCVQGCQLEDGRHLPAVQAGVCLVSTDFDGLHCTLSHPKAQRLCPCADRAAISALGPQQGQSPELTLPGGEPALDAAAQGGGGGGAAAADTP